MKKLKKKYFLTVEVDLNFDKNLSIFRGFFKLKQNKLLLHLRLHNF